MERAGKACQKSVLALIVMAAVMITTVGVTQAATANEKTAYSFFTDTMELNPAAACGIMSNIASESGFQANISGMGGAYGICQWTGPRLSRLKSWCRSHGYNYTTIKGQLYFLQYELKTYFPTVDNYLKTVKNSSSGAYNAGFYWCYYFERPANTYSSSTYRGNRAKSIYWPKFGSASTYVSAAAAENGMKLTWNATSKYGYLVKRGTKKDGTYTTVAAISSGTRKSYTDHGVVRGKKYYYYIVPLAKDGTNLDRSNKVSCIVKPSVQDSECRVKLSKTEYVYSGKARKPKVTVTYADERLALNKDYTILYNKNINAGTASVTVTGKGKYAGVLKKTFTIKKAQQTIKASSSVKTVQKSGSYALKVSASGKGKLKYDTSDPSVVAVKSGKLYLRGAGVAKITVKAAATANYTSASKVITMTVNPAKPAITGIVDKRQGMVQLKWKASKQLSGYEIQYTTGTSFKNAKKVNISGGSKASSLIENLKKGKTYRFRLRSYKLAGEKKLYSAWSGTKKITLKK